jgi:hypothetical protein
MYEYIYINIIVCGGGVTSTRNMEETGDCRGRQGQWDEGEGEVEGEGGGRGRKRVEVVLVSYESLRSLHRQAQIFQSLLYSDCV